MRKSAGSPVLCLSICFFLSTSVSAQQVSLTIFHTNDTHGHLLPFSYPSVVPLGSELDGLKVRTDIGGIARRAELVNRLRRELGSRGIAVWYVDAGDFSDGTPFSTEYHGEADVEAMNASGYDFGTLGNHEFNQPLASLKRVIALFRFPILCANALDTPTGKPLVQPSTTRRLGSLKIGIFGLTTRESGRYQAGKEGVTVPDEIETAQRMVKTLRPAADIVIAISHAGEQIDEKIASTVKGIDVIVGGHSHTRLPIGQFVWRSDELKPAEVNGTIIVQAHQWGGELGRLDLLFTRDHSVWRVDRYRERLIPVTSEIPEDEKVASVVDRYWKPISARYGEVLGQAAADFVEQGDDLAPYSLVADAVRETFGTDVELENIAGIRAPLVKGKITRADMIEVDPFENNVMTFKITGRQLKDILAKTRPAVSGLRYRIQNGVLVEVTVGGQPMQDDHVYSASTNSYFAGTALKGIDMTDTGRLRRDVVIDYIRKKGIVEPSYDGRRSISVER